MPYISLYYDYSLIIPAMTVAIRIILFLSVAIFIAYWDWHQRCIQNNMMDIWNSSFVIGKMEENIESLHWTEEG